MSAELFKQNLAKWLSMQTTRSNRHVSDNSYALMIEKLLAFFQRSREAFLQQTVPLGCFYGDSSTAVIYGGVCLVAPLKRLFKHIFKLPCKILPIYALLSDYLAVNSTYVV